jgi:hypothetical protein
VNTAPARRGHGCGLDKRARASFSEEATSVYSGYSDCYNFNDSLKFSVQAVDS